MAASIVVPPVAYSSLPDADPAALGDAYHSEVALALLRANSPTYSLYRDYYLGEHRLAFASDKFRTAFGHLFRAFADNLCPAVVDAVADRLVIDDWSIDGQGSEQGESSVSAVWRRNRGDRLSGEVHQEALREGDGYVLVWPDDSGAARLYPQRADRIVFIYSEDDPGVAEWAAKGWNVPSQRMYRLNIYYPDRIEKYACQSASATAIPDSGKAMRPFEVEGEPWPLPNAYGRVPIIHFATNAPVGGYGKSELADVVPLQDALNKAVTDMLVAMEYVALPQRYATGLEVEFDPETGKPKEPFRPGVERLWTSPAEGTRFGEFPAADLGQFTSVQDSFRAEVARVSGTPFHYLMLDRGGWPSGEAMKTAEARFLSRVNDRHLSFGASWSDVLRLALAIEGSIISDDVTIEPDWRDPAPRSEKEHVETLLGKVDLGLPKQQALIELGYSEDEVNTFMSQTAATAATAGQELMRALNLGGAPAPEVGGVPETGTGAFPV